MNVWIVYQEADHAESVPCDHIIDIFATKELAEQCMITMIRSRFRRLANVPIQFANLGGGDWTPYTEHTKRIDYYKFYATVHKVIDARNAADQ